MRSVSVLLFICLLLSCSDKPKEEPIDKGLIGKYLYMSKAGLLHSQKSCFALQREKDRGGHDVNGIEFVDTALICPNYKFYYCKKCFTDEQYEHVEQIIERNRIKVKLTCVGYGGYNLTFHCDWYAVLDISITYRYHGTAR